MNKINLSVSSGAPQLNDSNVKLANYSASLREKYNLNNKILLIQAPQFLLDSFNIKVAKHKGCYAYPPTGLQCIAKTLSTRNLEVDILDLNYQLLKRVINDDSFDYLNWPDILLEEYLKKNNPSIIGVTCISVNSDVFKGGHPLTPLLEYLHKKDKFIVIAGGTTATNEYENYLLQGLCHFVVEGEGENKINSLFDYLLEGKQSDICMPGIYFKFKNNIEETKGEKDTVVLKGNLIDTYRYVPVEDYHNVGSLNPFSRMAGQEKKFAAIQLTRGCRANCKFCGVIEFMGPGLRRYPVSDLLEEIYYLVEKRGVRHFEILDDDFLGHANSQEAVIAFLEEMSRLKKIYQTSWAAGNGLIAASLNEKILRLMRDSGCVGFRIGIESGNEEMLRRMRKPASLPVLRRAGRMLYKYPEFFVGGNYILGLFEEETFGEMLDTFRFSNEINLDWAAFTTFQFTSRARILGENLKVNPKHATDFIPAKDTSSREISGNKEILSGPEIFALSSEAIPSREQIKEIWFTFNLIANYINNKNLKPQGRPEKFVSWLEAVHIVYPENPYMGLFIGLGYMLLGNQKRADSYIEKTKENLTLSKYWRQRFEQFGLRELLFDFPGNAQEVQEALECLRLRYAKYSGKEIALNERV